MSENAENGENGENQLLEAFLNELSEVLQNLETALIDLESTPTDLEKINHSFRLFHNLKGTGAMMECFIIKDIAHFSESMLNLGRSKQIVLRSEHIDLFLEALSALKNLASNLKTTGKEGDERYFGLLQRLIDATKAGQQAQGGGAAAADDHHEEHKKEEKKIDSDQVKVSRGVIEQMMLLVGEFMQLKNKIHWLKHRYRDADYYDNCHELDQFSTKLQRNILKLRLSPVKPIFDSMRRVVRTTAGQVNKKIEFELAGSETLLDRSILDILGDPLMHLLRNAIDHGIENKEARAMNNKPPAGHVVLKADYKSGEVHISVADDGGGINADRIKAKAVEKGVITESQAANMSKNEAYQIIFMPGFSGAEKITETSGRGVGMDVVKSAIQGVGGQIEILTELGAGTTFIIRLPLSLAIVECLGFQVGRQTYAIPQLNVEEVLSFNSSIVQENLKTIEGEGRVLVVRGAPTPILRLGEILDESQDRCEALIQVRHGRHRFILEVGSILGPLSIVSQPLPPTFAKDAPFSGITKQGDGSLLFQLDVARLFNFVESKAPRIARKRSENRGAAGLSQEGALLTSSDLRRLQQKTIVFKNGLHFCLPVQRVKRIVFVSKDELKEIGTGGKSFFTLEGGTIPLIWVEELLLRQKRIRQDNYSLLLFQHGESTFGIPIVEFLGIERMPESYKTDVSEPGILGTTVIKDSTCLAIDLPALVALFSGKSEKPTTAEAATVRPTRILCAEDDKFFSSELTATLSGAGYEVIMCEDGLIAKEKLSDPNFAATIDLIITDIEMPRLNGYALCRWIKSTPHTQPTPVIAYTAITTDDMRKKMLAAGAKAFVSKMALERLLTAVEATLSGKDDVATEEQNEIVKTDRVVTFQLGYNWYALPMENIKEVSPITATANIPKTEKWLGQVTSFRGAMIPVLDLQGYFKIEGVSGVFEQAVVEVDQTSFALRVGRIGEVIIKSQLQSGDGLPKLTEKEQLIGKHVLQVYQYRDQVISLLDPNSLNQLCVRIKQEKKEEIAA